MENLVKVIKGRFPPNSSGVLWLNGIDNRLYHCGEDGWTPLNDENIRIDDISKEIVELKEEIDNIEVSGGVEALTDDEIRQICS